MIEFILGLSPGLLVAAVIIAFIGLISQMSLYAKAGQPAISALVPVWNVVVFCKVVGRPAKHAALILVPIVIMFGIILVFWPQIDGLFPVHGQGGVFESGPTKWEEVTVPFAIIGAVSIPLAYFVIIMFIEVCDSFGKHETIDKLLCVIFNGIYILFALGISDAIYESPWYARKRGLPYYMPDFKHKGKKYLVTPEGPLVGSAKDQKLKIKVVDTNLTDTKTDAKIVSNPEKKKPKTEASKVDKTNSNVQVKDGNNKIDTGKEVVKKVNSGKTWREELAEKYKKKK